MATKYVLAGQVLCVQLPQLTCNWISQRLKLLSISNYLLLCFTIQL